MLAVELTPGWVFLVAIAGPVVALASVVVARNGIGAQIKSAERTRDLDIKRQAYVDALAHQWRRMMWTNDAWNAVLAHRPLPSFDDNEWAWAEMSARLAAVGSVKVQDQFRAAILALNAFRNWVVQLAIEEAANADHEVLAPYKHEALDLRQAAEDQGTLLAEAVRAELIG